MTKERMNQFNEELSSMDMEAASTRLADLDEEVRNLDDVAEIELRTEMKKALKERMKELEELEARRAELEAINSGEVEPEVIEERKEEKNMSEMVYGIESKEYRNAWLKSIQGRELTEVEQRAYAAADGSNAVPTIVADRMLQKMKAVAPLIDEITLTQIAGSVKFVTEGTNNAATKHTENASLALSSDTVVSITLAGKEFMKVIGISKQAKAMSVDAFEDFLVAMLARDIARKIDDYIINDSSNGIANITWTTNTNQVVQTATTGYGYADICALIGMLPAGYDGNAKFLINKSTLWNKVKGIVDTQKRPIFNPETKTICGYPVLVDDYVATTAGAIYFGDFEQVVGNFAVPVQVESDESSGFTYGTVNYRGYAVFDSKPAITEAFVRLVTTA